ncbi:MAG: SDR family NAD(P)-dependent oxidoreductase, partial [Pseudomonadales bacterium]
MRCYQVREVNESMNRLQGKTALVTGSARGLGARIAERFVEEGAHVILNDLSIEAARSYIDFASETTEA